MRALILSALFAGLAVASEPRSVPILTIADSINPGTGDYVSSAIQEADKQGAPYLVIQMDTPGGLLNTTRQIVQSMLNAKTPIIVFVGPRGAHAGSAGALISFASDVVAMAPGTNIGAAHPVAGAGEKMDKTMEDKIANDVAAFAESLAKAKGRNTEWAIKAVRKSASIGADEALKAGVIDLMADDLDDLLKKVSGWKLKIAKAGTTTLATDAVTPHRIGMSIKQRVVSFLSDPSLAYLIMTLGGLCIWVELSHPGMIFPGILGAVCIIISLVSFQTLPIDYGALALIALGMALLIAELFLPTYGVLGLGGILAFVFGSLFLMDTDVPEFRLSLSLILPTAAVLAAASLVIGWLVMKTRRTRALSGPEAMVGCFGEVREAISENAGKVFVHGELWNALSSDGAVIAKGSIIIVNEVREMRLIVAPKP